VTECPSHPGAESVGACARCGRFYCAPEQIELDGKVYCADCGVREDVDWLGQHYRKLEGKRSGLAWAILLIAAPFAALGLFSLVGENSGQQKTIGLALIFYALAAFVFFTGTRWGRLALLSGATIAGGLLTFAIEDYWGLLIALPILGLSASAWTDLRTKLFYRVPVARKKLLQHYQREGSNPLAIQASRLALLGLFIPGVGVISLVMGVMSLTRIDKKAVPPVGNLSAAVAAVVFSLFTTAFWALSMMSSGW
jgi:hypothetical protein